MLNSINYINNRLFSSNLENLSNIKILDNFNEKEFGHYLAGYIEGDGSIITPSSFKSSSGSNKVCSFQIIFHISDLEFVKFLRKRIGHGNIYFSKNSQTVRLMIQNLQGVLYIINLINGKMRTPKINALYSMIDWLN